MGALTVDAVRSTSQGAGVSNAAESGRLPRVLALADHLGHSGGKVHGGTTYFTSVWPRLVAAGVSITACFMSPEHPAAKTLRDGGVETVFLNRSSHDPRVAWDVKRLIDERRPDVIHAASLKSMYLARRYASRVGAGTIIHLHDTKRLSLPMRLLQKSVAPCTGLALCVSGAVAELASLDFGVDASHIQTLHNGIDLSRFQQALPEARSVLRDTLSLPPNSKLIGVVGRLTEMKGQRYIIEAMPAVLKRVPSAVLLVIGEGADRASLEALACSSGLGDAVRFLGQRGDIPGVLAGLDVVAMPSIWGEGMPYAAIEAIASGLPVVAFPTAGIPDVVVHDKTGLLVNTRDSSAMADAVADVLSDTTLHAHLSHDAWVHSRGFSIEKHVSELICAYRAVAGISLTLPVQDHGPPKPTNSSNPALAA